MDHKRLKTVKPNVPGLGLLGMTNAALLRWGGGCGPTGPGLGPAAAQGRGSDRPLGVSQGQFRPRQVRLGGRKPEKRLRNPFSGAVSESRRSSKTGQLSSSQVPGPLRGASARRGLGRFGPRSGAETDQNAEERGSPLLGSGTGVRLPRPLPRPGLPPFPVHMTRLGSGGGLRLPARSGPRAGGGR